MQRAGRLLAQARALGPGSARVLNTALYWLRSVGRCAEVIETAEHAIRIDPNRIRTVDRDLQRACRVQDADRPCRGGVGAAGGGGRAQSAQPWKFSRYRHMGFAALMLGRDQEAIAFLQRSLAMNPKPGALQWTYRMLAAAHARTGQIDEAGAGCPQAGTVLALRAQSAAFTRKS